MKRVYFVTEGSTDQIVIEGLIDHWLSGEDFIPRHIQPPSSVYAEGLGSNLCEGWKGVRDWCTGRRAGGPSGRDEVLLQADCLIIHIDADVATDPEFKTPVFNGPCPPARNACDWIRDHLISLFGGVLPPRAVLCVPSQDMETWVLCALHPDIADANSPIECKDKPEAMLFQKPPHRLVRSKAGRLRKVTINYKKSLSAIVKGWINCTKGGAPRCPEAVRFENETKRILGV